MKNKRVKTLGLSLRWHRYLAWLGGLAFLMFGLSGLTHPIMTRTGPEAANFFPPQTQINPLQVQALPQILNQLDQARIIKVLPTGEGLKLQVSGDTQRRYFHLESGQELNDYDEQHAVWLARYYAGDWDSEVRSIAMQTEFSDAYPWVNRLLPVYKVEFERTDQLTAFVHTETNALGNLTNRNKTAMQAFFRNLHTWAWLEKSSHFRVIALSLMLLCLFGMASTGLALIVLMKRRKRMPPLRFAHRFLSYLVFIPVLAFSASGFYHLLHHAYDQPMRGMTLASPISIQERNLHKDMLWLEGFQDIQFNSLSLITGPDDRLYYRLSISPEHTEVLRSARFDGISLEKGAIYIDAERGELAQIDDEQLSIFYAEKEFGFAADLLQKSQLVTRFSHQYDFRNKRLPVWQLQFNTPLGDVIFIDPVTGALVDRSQHADRMESLSFSALHKWNILAPVIGRQWRDYLIMLILVLGISMTGVGYALMLRSGKSR